ncbi:PQQ-binding-like beta-propeller repeat protein [Nannocystis pusilla]|uniref:outer membrane protein assembly factor BamB family protein n=1 Tax=Nannocystis pusilla TaxID=889268 RepID=UPI003B7D1C21
MPEKTGPDGQVTAPPSALAPGPGARIALDVRGRAVVALPDRVVVLDDDFRHLRGFDPVTGAELWRVQAQPEARGQHTLYAVGDRVLLYAGPDLVAVDARRGELVATHSARAYNGGDSHCRLDITHGFVARGRRWTVDDPALTACATACTCTRRLFRCDSGAPIGKPFDGSEIYLHDELEQSASMMCLGAPNLFGRIGGKYLLGVRARPDAYEAIAVDREGKVLWRRPELSAAVEPYRRLDGDGAADVCWSIDSTSMVAWTCSTGQIRWRAQFPGEAHQFSGEAHVVAPGLLLVRRHSESELQVELRDVTTGKQRWRRTLPPDRVALAPGEDTDVLAYAQTTTYAWLDLRTGATLREHTLAKEQSLTRDPASDGYIRLGGPQVALLSRDGEVLQTVPKDTPGSSGSAPASSPAARSGASPCFGGPTSPSRSRSRARGWSRTRARRSGRRQWCSSSSATRTNRRGSSSCARTERPSPVVRSSTDDLSLGQAAPRDRDAAARELSRPSWAA